MRKFGRLRIEATACKRLDSNSRDAFLDGLAFRVSEGKGSPSASRSNGGVDSAGQRLIALRQHSANLKSFHVPPDGLRLEDFRRPRTCLTSTCIERASARGQPTLKRSRSSTR